MKKRRFESTKFAPGCGRADPRIFSAMPTFPLERDTGTTPRPVLVACRFAVTLLVTGTFLVTCTRPSQPSANGSVQPTARAVLGRKAPVPRTIAPLSPAPEQRLGVVRIIGAHASFVLIETPSASVSAAAPAGRLLHCHPPGVTTGTSTADLRVSAERRPPFVIADVVAGMPSVGDVAYLARDNDPALVPIRPVVPFSSVIPAAEPASTPASAL